MNEDDTVQVLVDPLILLKDIITRGKLEEVVIIENEFLFNFYNCALNFQTPTRCRNRRGESLNLNDLYLFITYTKNKKYTMKIAQENGCKFINILEKKNILEFLEEFSKNTDEKNEGIPLNYSLQDLCKFECINSDFSLQPCRLIDKKINKILNLNYPWVEYKKESDEFSNSLGKENKNFDLKMIEENNMERNMKEEIISNKKQINTISQIYPINIDYICQGIDMYSRINTLITFMNEPTKNDSKKRDLNLISNSKSLDIRGKVQNIDGNNSRNVNNDLSKNIGISKSGNSRQSRSTLLAYLNSNNLNPIILVPPSSKSPITMSNIVQFLRDKVFIDPNTVNRSLVGNEQTITLNFGSGTTSQKVTFRILESTLNFRKRDWYSLIAVFLTGAEWQLQSFPFKSIPDIFTMIKGYHITYDSEPIPENIRKWNVDVVRINRTNRHNDLSVWFQFMESIESVLASSRDHSKLDRSKL